MTATDEADRDKVNGHERSNILGTFSKTRDGLSQCMLQDAFHEALRPAHTHQQITSIAIHACSFSSFVSIALSHPSISLFLSLLSPCALVRCTVPPPPLSRWHFQRAAETSLCSHPAQRRWKIKRLPVRPKSSNNKSLARSLGGSESLEMIKSVISADTHVDINVTKTIINSLYSQFKPV